MNKDQFNKALENQQHQSAIGEKIETWEAFLDSIGEHGFAERTPEGKIKMSLTNSKLEVAFWEDEIKLIVQRNLKTLKQKLDSLQREFESM